MVFSGFAGKCGDGERLSDLSGHHHSHHGAVGHGRRRRHRVRDHRRHRQGDHGGPDPVGKFHQRGGPAAQRQQSLDRIGGQRCAPGRYAQHQRSRQPESRFARNFERQHGYRVGQYDPMSTCLRNELQGHQYHRPDAAIPDDQPTMMNTRPMRRILIVLFAMCGSAELAACGMLPSKSHKPEPVARVLPPPTPRTDGAIYQAGQQMELFADLKARRVGDVLTIVLNESTNASKNAITKTAKTTSVANTGPTIFGKTITTKGVPILNTTMNGADSFDGEGSSTQSNSLAGSLTVTVIDVQANGNLVVQG